MTCGFDTKSRRARRNTKKRRMMAQPERIVNVIKQLVEIAAGPCENCTRLEAANARLRAAAGKARQNREARNLRCRVKAQKQRQARQRAAAEPQALEPSRPDAAEKLCGRPGCTNPIIPPQRRYCSPFCSRQVHRRLSIERAAEAMQPLLPHNTQQKVRTCLRCNHEFMSDGPGHRKCPKCSKIETIWPRQTMRTGRFVGE